MLPRRLALLVPPALVSLVLAPALSGCGDTPPLRTSFPPLDFSYLTPLRLNVADVEVRDAFVPGPGDLGAQAPVPPAEALRRLANDRIKPGGSTGRAVFVINDATVIPSSDGLAGTVAVELDVLLADNSRAAFAEARVQRRRTGGGDRRAALYDLVHDMMDDMNVELEFQVRRSLKDWLQVTDTAPPPAAVQQQDLGPPPGTTPTPGPGTDASPRPLLAPPRPVVP